MSVVPPRTKSWVLQNPPEKAVDFSDSPNRTFVLKTFDLPSEIPEDSILIKVVYLSNDPAQRGWIQKDMSAERLYVPPVKVGEVMRAGGIGKIVKVGGQSDKYKEGDLVYAAVGWSEYTVVKKGSATVLNLIPGVSPTVFIGALGGPGLTAYWGLVDVLKFKVGESIVVSGAAGGVGNIVVQLAKNVFGAKKVIGIVGSDEKAEFIRGLGADVALNYKSPTFKQDLIDATPDFVETYFDNVGGAILDLMLSRLKPHGRIAACGAISTYNDLASTNLTNYFEIVANRLEIKGFIVFDYLSRPEGRLALANALKENKIVVNGAETLVPVSGIEEVPQVWHMLFEGRNTGKLVTQLP